MSAATQKQDMKWDLGTASLLSIQWTLSIGSCMTCMVNDIQNLLCRLRIICTTVKRGSEELWYYYSVDKRNMKLLLLYVNRDIPTWWICFCFARSSNIISTILILLMEETSEIDIAKFILRRKYNRYTRFDLRTLKVYYVISNATSALHGSSACSVPVCLSSHELIAVLSSFLSLVSIKAAQIVDI